jgi:hypothetical protein
MNTLKDIFDQLVEWKELPSYQAERRLDIFFGYFLKKILKSCKYIHTNDPIKILPEFPLVDKENPNGQWKVKTKVANDKENGQWRSKHIDFLVTDGCQCIAVELKTDNKSISESQLKYYDMFMNETWDEIRGDIETLYKHTKEKRKYQILIDHLKDDMWQNIKSKKVVYIQPQIDEKDKEINSKYTWRKIISFDDILPPGFKIDERDFNDPWKCFLYCLTKIKKENNSCK